MSTQVQRRKGTTAQHASFTGASAELTVDTTKNTVVVHDGATAGGIPLAKETGSALSVTSLVSSGAASIEATDTAAALRITQLGTGNALLVEDSSNPDSSPFVIDTAGRVAIGHIATVAGNGPVTSTRPSLQVHGLSNSTSGAGVYNWSSTASLTSAFTFNRSLSNVVGTLGSAVTSGTSLGALSFSGDDGVSFYEAARIQAQADATATTGSTPGRLVFSTTPTGTVTPVERLRIASNGDISIAGGTANGVTYLNGSKVLTSGTALTFDGTNLGIGAASPFGKLNVANGAGKGFEFWPEIATSTNAIFNYDRTGGTYQDFQVRAATHQWLIGAAEAMRLTSTGLGIGTSSPTDKLSVYGDTTGTVGIKVTNNNATGVDKYISMFAGGTSSGVAAWNNSGVVESAVGANLVFSGYNGTILFQTGTSRTERMRLDSSGNLLVGATSTAYGERLNVVTSGAAATGGYFLFNSTDDRRVLILQHVRATGATSATMMAFLNASSAAVGSITANGTATLYNTTSDYRLKTVIGPVANAGQRIDALQPVEYTWNASGDLTRGFLAHQFQEVYAGSVSGVKDAVDAEGKPVYQSMQASSSEVIADLIAEIQDLRKRLAAAGI